MSKACNLTCWREIWSRTTHNMNTLIQNVANSDCQRLQQVIHIKQQNTSFLIALQNDTFRSFLIWHPYRQFDSICFAFHNCYKIKAFFLTDTAMIRVWLENKPRLTVSRKQEAEQWSPVSICICFTPKSLTHHYHGYYNNNLLTDLSHFLPPKHDGGTMRNAIGHHLRSVPDPLVHKQINI